MLPTGRNTITSLLAELQAGLNYKRALGKVHDARGMSSHDLFPSFQCVKHPIVVPQLADRSK